MLLHSLGAVPIVVAASTLTTYLLIGHVFSGLYPSLPNTTASVAAAASQLDYLRLVSRQTVATLFPLLDPSSPSSAAFVARDTADSMQLVIFRPSLPLPIIIVCFLSQAGSEAASGVRMLNQQLNALVANVSLPVDMKKQVELLGITANQVSCA